MSLVVGVDAYTDAAQALAAEQRHASGAAFVALTNPQRENALIDTASKLNALDYAGTPLDGSQPMAFPRTGARSDALMRMAQANIEEAIQRAKSYGNTPAAEPTINDVRGSVIEQTAGALTQKWAPVSGVAVSAELALFSDRTREWIRPLLASSVVPVARNYGQGSKRRVS